MNKLALLAAAALTVSSFGIAGAMAQAGGTDSFATVDANKDGSVDQSEAMGAYATLTPDLFAKADANADGKLDEAEFGSLLGLVGALGQSTDTTTSSSSAASSDASSSSAAQ